MDTLETIRTYEDHFAYKIHKQITNEFFITIDDYLNTLLFDSKHCGHVLVKNKFPYKNTKQHLVLWIQSNYDDFYDDDRIRKIVDISNNFIFMTSLENRSVVGIRHYHVIQFIR
jgi:hypothetical protein